MVREVWSLVCSAIVLIAGEVAQISPAAAKPVPVAKAALTEPTLTSPAPVLTGTTFDPALAATLVAALKTGGHVIYFRHFETGKDVVDTGTAKMGNCATQRQLNASGAAQAVVVRNAFQKQGFPVSRVYSSPFCRAWQSADLAFGRHKTVENLKLATSPADKVSKKAARQMAKALWPLLIAKPKPGTSTIIVAHDDNLPTVGVPKPETQGEALLFKPTGRGFKLVMQVKPDVWARLVEAQAQAS
jgi:hypothetical protein